MRRTRNISSVAVAALVGLSMLVAPASAGAVTISGVAYKDELGTTWQGCDTSTANLRVAVNGSAGPSTSCNPATGAFSFTGVTIPAVGAVVAIWFDGAPVKGALYTTAASTTSNIAGLTPTQDRVWVRTEQASLTATTNSTFLWTKAQDADVPVALSGSDMVLDADVELHVEAPVTFRSSGMVDANTIHVRPGATYDGSAGQTTITGIGTQPCDKGPDLARPLCVEGSFAGSGRVRYFRQHRPYTVEAVRYGSLLVAADPGGTGIIGHATGQLLQVDGAMDVSSSLQSDPHAANVDVGGIWLNGWANNGGGPATPSWSGTRPFTITFRWSFEGGGQLDLPGATVRGNLTGPKSTFGPGGGDPLSPDWSVRSVVLRNTGYWRWGFGSGTTGMTTPVGDAAPDRVVDLVGAAWDNGYSIMHLGRNGGDWGIVKYDFDGQPDGDWDDGDLNSTDDDGDALLAFNSGGTTADVPRVAALDPSTGALLVGGSSAGDWMLRRYDSHGRLDTTFNGSGVLTADLGGVDEIRGLVWQGGTMAVSGTGGATPAWRFRTWSNAGSLGTDLTWTNGGAPAEVRAMCSRNGPGTELYVVGRVGVAGSRDWAVKRVNASWTAWDYFGPADASTAWTWDAGSSEDEATSCAAETSDNLYVAGTTGTGASDDGRVRRFWSDGWPNGDWGDASGTLSFGGAGDDDVHDIVTDEWGDNITIVGRDPGNGGQAIIRRYDGDGAIDTTWGAGGSITWDDGAALDGQATAAWWDAGQYLRVGVTTSTNAGDAAVRRYDYNGDLMTTSEPGRVRVVGMNSWYERARIRVEDTLQVGDPADSGPIILDLEGRDPAVQVESRIVTHPNATVRASSTSPLVANGDVTIGGPFLANAGEVRLESQSRATISTVASTQFNHLSIAATSKDVSFSPANPIRVRGTFRVRGSSCAEPVVLRSAADPTPWTLDLAGGGTADVRYAEVRAGTATPAATATDSRSLGGNSGWTISGCAGSSVPAPDGMQVEGTTHAQAVGTPNPAMSWVNRTGATVDRADVEVYSSPRTNQAALWRFDGSGADSAGAWTLTPAAATTYPTGRFGQAGSAGATFDGYAGGDLDLAADFTVDGWLKTSLATAEQYPDVVYKGDATRTAVNYRLGFNVPSNTFEAMMTVSGGNVVRADIPAATVADGAWHHVAMVHRAGRVLLFVDGTLRRTADGWVTSADQGAWPVRLGWRLGGEVDDWRVSTVAYSAADLRGFVQTGRRHADLVWDADPADSTGALLGTTAANGARATVNYGGAAGSLRLGGARYWGRARFRTQSTSTWSNWSDVDWWEMDQSITAAVVSNATVALGSGGATLPGTDVVGTATFEVQTTNFHGYSSFLEGPSDTWAMSDGLPGANHQIPGRGTAGTPIAWSPGVPGFFGVSLLSMTGGKDTTRWGIGTTTSDLSTLNWGWGSPSARLLLGNRATYDTSPQQLVLAVRANAPVNVDPGTYTTTLVFTAVPNV